MNMSGASNESYETTASWAAAEASTQELARETERNAQLESTAAHVAAKTALERSPRMTDEKVSQTSAAVDQLERDASQKTNQAVMEGQRDVQDIKNVGASYLSSVIEAAKPYLPSAVTDTGDLNDIDQDK